MKHGGWFGVVALVAGTTLGGVEALHAAHWGGSAAQEPTAAMLADGMGGSKSGHGHQGYLGVETRDVNDDELAVLKLKESVGAEITNLDHDGPACKAGMQVRDVILQMNGQMIADEYQLKRMLRDLPAKRTVNFVISRDGQSQTVSMQTADRRTIGLQAWEQHYTVPDPGAGSPPPSGLASRGNGFMGTSSGVPAAPAPKGHRDFLATSMIVSSSFTGAKLELMGPQLAQYFGADGGAGLLVRSVDAKSPAEQAGMKAGDVVVRINSSPVASDTDWIKTVHDNKGRPLPVVVIRDKHEQTLMLTPDGKKRSSMKTGCGLEEFFEETSQHTRGLLAKL